ncbi:hypothetical protein V8F20_002241 [Naviculisporaceae sp. PSN 640]
MAEALGIAASVFAVVQLAGSCVSLSKRWIGPSKFGSSDLASLKSTLCGFSQAISEFYNRLGELGNVQSRQENMESLRQVLEGSRKALDVVQRFMTSRGMMGKYLIAPISDGELKVALKDLEAAKERFMFALQTDNLVISFQSQQCLHQLEIDSKNFRNETNNGLKRIHENVEEEGRENKKFREDSRMFHDTTTSSLMRLEGKMAAIVPAQATEDLSSRLGEKQKRRLMKSLKFEQIDTRHSTIRNAHARTCKWVLRNPEYNDWLDSDKLSDHCGFMWIKGKPGAGKSTLMKFLLAQAKKTMKNDIIISFFFNARGINLEKSTVGMYRSLLFQLLTQQPGLQDAKGAANTAAFDYPDWELEPLKTLFEEAIHSSAHSSIMCFIDALDECDESEIRNMISFFESLGELATSINVRFRVCFSSRHYPHITVKRGLSLTLEGQEGHTQDLINYVETELKIGHSKLAQVIRVELQEKAQGVFMWVVLVVEILNKEHDRGNIHRLRKRLQDIPGDLYALFRSIFNKDGNDRDKLLLCVQWVLFAREPLTPEELYFAVSCEFEPDILQDWDPRILTPRTIQLSILDSSKGLIEVTSSETQTVQFIHESVKDFLLESNGLQEVSPELGYGIEGKSHERLKRCCLAQLEINVNANKMFPFLKYATHNVLYHSNLAETGGISQTGFLSSFQARKAQWIRLNNRFKQKGARPDVETMSLLYILAELNCAALIRVQPREKSCFEYEKTRYGLPFVAALATQSTETVAALLYEEAQAQPPNRPLHELARRFSDGEGKRLVLHRDFKYSRKRGALSYAIEFGDPVIFACFLEVKEFEIETKDRFRQTPLILACQAGRDNIVKFLLGRGADMEAKDIYGQTPLMHSATYRQKGAVKLLLSHGADIEASDTEGSTPLIMASGQGDADVVEILVENRANLEARDNTGRTPLMAACKNGEKHVIEMLLGKGANIEAKDTRGWTSLMYALEGDGRVVDLLLRWGANIEARSRTYWTPLMHASRACCGDIMRTLLEKGADIEAQADGGRTVLMLASLDGQTEAAYILLEKGANIEAEDETGHTPLMLASQNGRRKAVELLLERGASIDTQNLSKYKPLWPHFDFDGYRLVLEKAEEERRVSN